MAWRIPETATLLALLCTTAAAAPDPDPEPAHRPHFSPDPPFLSTPPAPILKEEARADSSEPPAADPAGPPQPAFDARLVTWINESGRRTLVGASAQLYRPAGKQRWQRDAAGGVAVDVRRAFASPGGTLFAVGSASPLFAREGGTWASFPLPNHGPCAANPGPIPAIAVGRHVYLLEGESWRRQASARSTITALWATSPTRMYAATHSGALAVLSGRAWTNLRSPLPPGDTIRHIIGVAGQHPIAISDSGAVLELGNIAARALPREVALEGMEIQALGTHKGTVFLAGTTAEHPERAVLVRIHKGKLVLDATLWPLAPGDRVALVAGGTDLLVATARGQVRSRRADGTWVDGVISPDLPAPPPEADGRAAPARSR
jgi:hypothetical protein